MVQNKLHITGTSPKPPNQSPKPETLNPKPKLPETLVKISCPKPIKSETLNPKPEQINIFARLFQLSWWRRSSAGRCISLPAVQARPKRASGSAATWRGEKTCRSCWNVLSLRSHNLTLSDDDPQHTAAFFSGVAALREELGGPVFSQNVKHLLIKQVALLVRDTRQHEVKRPFRPLAYSQSLQKPLN